MMNETAWEKELQERRNLEETVKRHGFSEAHYLREGISGNALHVIDAHSGQPALLKISRGTYGITEELDTLAPEKRGRQTIVGLNQITGYPLAQIPEGVTLEPTIRGLANIRNGTTYINGKFALLLDWIEEAVPGEPGYHRLDHLIPERYRTWTDAQILDIVAPFAYLLSQAHQRGVIYNDIGADKADHLYYDESRHQLKVIDWGNVIFTSDADYNYAKQPFHDVAGLARLIYCMRTNEDGFQLERTYSKEVLRDNLLRTGHPALANLVFRSLILPSALSPDEITALPEQDRPILEGTALYVAIEDAIRVLRPSRLVLRRPERPVEPRRGRIVAHRPAQRSERPDRIVIRKHDT